MTKYGYKMDDERKERISRALTGRKKPPFSDEHRKKLSMANIGKSHSLETRKKQGRGGKNHWNWKGGIQPINKTIRISLEYKLWRESVFLRDNYTCVWCGVRGGTIHADHIKPFALFPELRFSIDNGRTLCVQCHRTTDTFGGKTRVPTSK